MHPNPRKAAPVVLTIVILASLTYWFFVVRPAKADSGDLTATGKIEAIQVRISPELGGRALEVLATKGDSVQAGDALVEIDPSLLTAQRDQAAAGVTAAQANAEAAQSNAEAASLQGTAAEAAQNAAQAALDAAGANLALLDAGATPEQIAVIQAQAVQAQAGYQAALASFAALTGGVAPDEIAAAQARLIAARESYESLTVSLSDEQIENFNALTQAINYFDFWFTRPTEPDSIIAEALPAIQQETTATSQIVQAALTAVEDDSLPFAQQLEAARLSAALTDLALVQAIARQEALQDMEGISEEGTDDLQSYVDAAQELADAAQDAFDALNDSEAGGHLQALWDEVQSAQAALNRLGRGGTTPLESVLHQLEAAQALSEAAQANYENLVKGARPEQLAAAQAQVHAAQAQLDAAGSNLSTAQSRAAAASAQAEAAQSQVAIAQAAVDVFDVQLAKLTLISPIDGVVLARAIEPGELAAPGAPLLVLADLSRLTITVFVPEDRYGQINLGQNADVKVDSFPGQTFTATVTHIADQAEFTPRNVQTAEGRKTTVFAVELSLANADGKLKAGMPADVSFK